MARSFAECARELVRELSDEWHDGERSAMVDLNDIEEILERLADKVEGVKRGSAAKSAKR